MRLTIEQIRNNIILGALLLIIIFLIGFAYKHDVKAEEPETTIETESEEIIVEETTEAIPVVYGKYDPRSIDDDIEMLWKGSNDWVYIPCELGIEEQEFVYYLCENYNLDYYFVMALMYVESGYNPNIISTTNDYGLMQINACNHAWLSEELGITDFLDPYENMKAGCFVLRLLFEKYQDPTMVAMAYNMGEDGAQRLWNNGVYSSAYSRKIMTRQDEIQQY